MSGSRTRSRRIGLTPADEAVSGRTAVGKAVTGRVAADEAATGKADAARCAETQEFATPDDRLERALGDEGFCLVAGLDEVGRGAWAGPVSVGVVVFPDHVAPPDGLRDSKMLTEERREELFPLITEWCTEWSVGHAGPDECDRLGMTVALRLAARRALGALGSLPEALLMDGAFDYVSDPSDAAQLPGLGEVPALPGAGLHVRTIVKGDARCVSIAAASILAKVTRDRMMRTLSSSFPAFDFDRNKGYPSRVHMTALAGFGLTSVHRRSWAFVDHMAFR